MKYVVVFTSVEADGEGYIITNEAYGPFNDRKEAAALAAKFKSALPGSDETDAILSVKVTKLSASISDSQFFKDIA